MATPPDAAPAGAPPPDADDADDEPTSALDDKLTPELQAKVCNALRASGFTKSAARYAGISRDTYYRWRKRGQRETTGKYRAFYDATEEARAAFILSLITGVAAAGKKDWKALAWLLEHLERKTFGPAPRAPAAPEPGGTAGGAARPTIFMPAEHDDDGPA